MKNVKTKGRLHKSVAALLIVSCFTSQVYGLSFSRGSTQQAPVLSTEELTQAPADSDEYFLTQAILLGANKKPICHIKLAGQAEMAPPFGSVPSDDLGTTQMNLRECDQDETEAIRLTSEKAVEKVQTAALPAFILAGVAICEMTGLAGGVIGSVTAAGLYSATGNVPGTVIGSMEGFMRSAGKVRWIRYAATAGATPIGFICGSLGDLVGYTGVYYLMEKAKQHGLISNQGAKNK